jgi:hypothetical protein
MTDTGTATQESSFLPKFHEFMKYLCEIAGQNKGHNHSLLFRKACLSFLEANNYNGTSKQIVAWMDQVTDDKAQNSTRVSSFNSTMRKWLLLHEDEWLVSIVNKPSSIGVSMESFQIKRKVLKMLL